MDLTSTFIGLAVFVAVLAFVLRPLVVGPSSQGAQRQSGRRSALARQMDQRAALLERRNVTYAAIRDLDFELATGKISEADHTQQRAELMKEGVALLKQLDRLEAAQSQDPLEAAISAMRRGEESQVPQLQAEPAANGHHTCPSCQSQVSHGDRFCGVCGTTLALACAECNSPYQSGDLFCAHCGAALEAQG
jgi:hypothetical protein